MRFNRRKMEDERRRVAEKEAAERPRLTRQAKHMSMPFSRTVGAAIAARYWTAAANSPR
jgi:hypothetical protein